MITLTRSAHIGAPSERSSSRLRSSSLVNDLSRSRKAFISKSVQNDKIGGSHVLKLKQDGLLKETQ